MSALEWTPVQLLSGEHPELPRVQACFVDDVENAADVLSAVKAGRFDRVLFLRSSKIANTFMLVVGILRALFREGSTTKALGVEIMMALGASRNIGGVLREFGIKKDDRSMLIVGFDATADDERAVAELLQGARVLSLDRLQDFYNFENAKRFYKLSSHEDKTREDVMQAIINRVSLGGINQ